MLKSFKYRIYPTAEQVVKIEKTIGCCRLVYNLALEVKMTAYKNAGIKLNSFALCYQLPELKEAYPWLKDVDSTALQVSIKKIDIAFVNFFNGKGYPKFKSKRGKQSFRCPGSIKRIDFTEQLLTIPKIPNIPIVISRTFEGKMKAVTISRYPSGKYFASILVDNGKDLPAKKPIKNTIGLDLGIKDFVSMSDGEKVDNPKYLRNNLKRLKCLQRRLSRTKKGSSNRSKAVKRVAIQHERITNQRNDFLQKLSTSITKKYDTICVETLNIGGMVKNHRLAQAISDASWSEFITMLKYKSDWYGNNLIQIGRFEPSSKMCYNCGVINELLTLKDREWTCADCGTLHDRDISAAINIKQIGLLKYSPVGSGVEPVELSALVGTMKQE